MRRLDIIDPGLQRTILAGRVTLSVLIGLGSSLLLLRLADQPGPLIMLGAMTAMQTTLAVIGPLPSLDARSPVLAWVVAALSAVLAVLVMPSEAARYIVFILVMAAAVWVRRYPRGFGLGMMAFNTYFFVVFVRATFAQLPWILVVLAAGILSSTLVRGVIVPDRPATKLRQLLRALHARAALLAADETDTTDTERERAARDIDEIVLQVHDVLGAHEGLVADGTAFQMDLFAVVSLSHLMLLTARHDTAGNLAPASVDPFERLQEHLSALERAVQGRGASLMRSAAPDTAEAAQPASEPERGLSDIDKATIQVTIAATLSIAVGSMLSDSRWYWAAMTAFFMFVNTSSRGATLRKAVERTAGTAAGILAGLITGYGLAGNPTLELVLIFPTIFVAFWTLKRSYAMMTVMITVMIALMYEMMGLLTPGLLLLRLGETVIGAGIGTAVAYLVLPTRTRSVVDDAFDTFFDGVAALLDELVAAARTGAARSDALDAVRTLDRAAGTLETTVRPVISTVPGSRARRLRRELVIAFTIRYGMHRLLARALFHATPIEADTLEDLVKPLRSRLAHLRTTSERPAGKPANARTTSPESDAVYRLASLLDELRELRLTS